MKLFKTIIPILFIFLTVLSCQEEEPSLSAIQTPTNLQISTDISIDGSGIVAFNATALNAITYKYFFGDGSSESSPTGISTKRFTKTGLNTYEVTIVAYGMGG
ncbi:MAG: PKD domain-containing protein, partial [Cellulophaga sp.]|nr:PKD domain-containing protein [Cellulophaga sp.]